MVLCFGKNDDDCVFSQVRGVENDDRGGGVKAQGWLTLECKANIFHDGGLRPEKSQFTCAAGTAYMIKLHPGHPGHTTPGLRNRDREAKKTGCSAYKSSA